MIGEAIVHKLVGIVVLFITARLLKFDLSDIGYTGRKGLGNLVKGLAFGSGVFVIAYGVEILILVLNYHFVFTGKIRVVTNLRQHICGGQE